MIASKNISMLGKHADSKNMQGHDNGKNAITKGL